MKKNKIMPVLLAVSLLVGCGNTVDEIKPASADSKGSENEETAERYKQWFFDSIDLSGLYRRNALMKKQMSTLSTKAKTEKERNITRLNIRGSELFGVGKGNVIKQVSIQ